MAEKKGLQKIGLQIPKIVLKAAGNDPKRLKKIRELFGKKKQPKLPGMKSGSGENGVVYSDKKGKEFLKKNQEKDLIEQMLLKEEKEAWLKKNLTHLVWIMADFLVLRLKLKEK